MNLKKRNVTKEKHNWYDLNVASVQSTYITDDAPGGFIDKAFILETGSGKVG